MKVSPLIPSYLLLLPFVWFFSRFLLFKVFLCFALYVYLSIFTKKKTKKKTTHKYYLSFGYPSANLKKSKLVINNPALIINYICFDEQP